MKLLAWYRRVALLAILLTFVPQLLLAQSTGLIKGQVKDVATQKTLIGANVVLLGTTEFKGAITDTNGCFEMAAVPFGIHALQISYVGYEEQVINDVSVYDRKGSFVTIFLKPASQLLEEAEVTAYSNPVATTDPLAMVSARSISMEETKRFAGSLGDPSRMALSYSGVNSGRGDNNDLIVRGNSAKYLQWKLEGLEIPNPNHFGVYGSSGGLLNILNGNNLGRSNFYLGAFPAHTGNALAGVFDLSLRNGNPTQRKHSIETSLIGLSVASEGPLKQGQGSYNMNYRYSTLGLMKQLGAFYQAPEYQDLTYKVNLPTGNNGTFTLYGMAGLGTWLEEDFFRRTDSLQYSLNQVGDTVYGYDEIVAENLNRYNLGVFGAKHVVPVGNKHVLTNNLNYSVVYNAPRTSDINRDNFTIFLQSEGRFTNSTVRYQPELTTYLNDNSSLHSGATVAFRSFHSKLIEGYPDQSTATIVNSTNNDFLGQAFVSYRNAAMHNIEWVVGVHHTFSNLNNQHVVEPRLAINYRASETAVLAFASGMHSAVESPEVYLMFTSNGVASRNLAMSRSWQNVLSYKQQLSEQLFFTAELYGQYLFDVPIAADSSNFSLINEEVSFTTLPLVNEGKGLNYGLELTLEKLFAQSYYFLLTTSLFQSEYKLMEPFYRKTKYSNSYIVNALGGKEFKLKETKFFGVNVRGTFSGGSPYVPVLLDESVEVNQEVRDYQRAYSQQLPPYIGIDFSMNYRWIKPKASHEVKLDIFRMVEQNYYDEVYVPENLNSDGSVSPAMVKQVKYGEGQTSTTLLPVLYYKLSF